MMYYRSGKGRCIPRCTGWLQGLECKGGWGASENRAEAPAWRLTSQSREAVSVL